MKVLENTRKYKEEKNTTTYQKSTWNNQKRKKRCLKAKLQNHWLPSLKHKESKIAGGSSAMRKPSLFPVIKGCACLRSPHQAIKSPTLPSSYLDQWLPPPFEDGSPTEGRSTKGYDHMSPASSHIYSGFIKLLTGSTPSNVFGKS